MHSALVAAMSIVMQPEVYVEIGIYKGETWTKCHNFCGEVHLVDPAPLDQHYHAPIHPDKRDLRNVFFYDETSDEFFSHFKKKIDLIFIDGDHSYKSVKKDFNNAIKLLNPNGMILLHDTDPVSAEYITGGSHGGCGDVHIFLEELNEADEYSIITLPATEAGLTLVKRKGATRKSAWGSTGEEKQNVL